MGSTEERDNRVNVRSLLPFIALFLIALALVGLERPPHPFYAVAGGLLIGLAAITTILLARLDDSRIKSFDLCTLIPVVMICFAVHFLRESSGAGVASGYGPLFLVPVIWQSLRRPRNIVIATVVIVAAANAMGVILLPSQVSLAAQWRAVIVFDLVVAAAAITIHGLVTERDKLLEQSVALSERDPLTGVANRRVADRRLPAAVAESNGEKPISVVMIDLDHFKRFNDTHGHAAGDDLLRRATAAWSAQLRANDLLFRMGGEEFAILLPGADEKATEAVLRRLQSAMPMDQTFSAGFAVLKPGAGELISADELLRRADEAMYQAKAAGRNQFVQSA